MKFKTKHHTFTVEEVKSPKIRYFKVDNGAYIVTVVDDKSENKIEHCITAYVWNPVLQISTGVVSVPLYETIEKGDELVIDESRPMRDIEETIQDIVRHMFEDDEDDEPVFFSALTAIEMMQDLMEDNLLDDEDYDEWEDEDEGEDDDEGEWLGSVDDGIEIDNSELPFN